MTAADVVLASGRLALALVFLLSGTAKAVDLRGTQHAVAALGAPRFLAQPAGVLLPMVECVVALMLASATLAWWGAVAALVLLLAFTVAITMSLARGERPPCHCFGQLHARPIGWHTVVRNALFAAVAGLILILSNDRSPDQASFTIIVPIAGAVLLAGFIGNKMWGRGESSDADVVEGLPIGTAAPPFQLPTPTGDIVALDRLIHDRPLTALVFTEPMCPRDGDGGTRAQSRSCC
jgi:hypothetical protein